MHLEYRIGYHFIAHERLSKKNVLGGLKRVPQKTLFKWEDPKIVFFNFMGAEMLKPLKTICILIQLNETYNMVPISTINIHSVKMVEEPSSFLK